MHAAPEGSEALHADEEEEKQLESVLPGASQRLASMTSMCERANGYGSRRSNGDGRAALRKMFGYQRHYKLEDEPPGSHGSPHVSVSPAP